MDILHYINGTWHRSEQGDVRPVHNPATGELLGSFTSLSIEEVDHAVATATTAFRDWSNVPVTERIQYLFRLKTLLEENLQDLARTITMECGKTLAEAVGELRRGIENVETACAMPLLIQGYNNEDLTRGIDEHLFRQPLGVAAAITPFNFPAMIPLWFLPYALAAGNCFLLKPSEQVPMTAVKIFELLEQTKLPPGVAQLLHGEKEVAQALIQHPDVDAISFVGSSPAAHAVYREAAHYGKRVQCQGGAKNPVVVLPDADPTLTTSIIADSAFGCAGQRCLATSIVIAVGQAHQTFRETLAETARSRRVGYGLDAEVEMGPVITHHSRERIHQIVEKGVHSGATLCVDGRDKNVSGYAYGSFVFPTLLDDVSPHADISSTEIFGPVLSLIPAQTIDEAIDVINSMVHGNMACLFTSDGASARRFRREVKAGNIGINIGVAAPMSYYPFSGWKSSFLGDLHAQGRHAVEFYTQTKVVVERWYPEWNRKF
ncbi:MAG: CoA-acylating methylmalonate-semialdehyde dehydrogenase [Planctomycetota bacterium]|nr:CoA-acylating methylmalonate-semialdehyde dehydrogenase [Planctomycetota bacterium]MDA1211632.1 CoA-acylating methylmalonate-semialdehyde dehydrogenase [Planctomycetota bacterium]